MSKVRARPAIRNGARTIRLPLVLAVAMAGLGLLGGSAEAARMWLPKTVNPYCDVTTYVLRDLPEQAMSIRELERQARDRRKRVHAG